MDFNSNATISDLTNRQKDFFWSTVKNSSTRERIKKLKKIKKWILENKKAINEAIYNDFKKPEVEVVVTDIKPVLTEIDHCCNNLHVWMSPKSVSTPLFMFGTQSQIKMEGKGVALILAPWNFPFMLTVGPLVTAIAAGCCCVIKPSENTPHTAALIEKMAIELFDENEVKVILGDATLAGLLTEHPGFDHIFFTGSPAIGKKVMQAAAKNLTSITLELGGRNPAIVDESANISDTAEKLIWGKCMNNGQSCVSPNYILVHKNKFEDLKKALKIKVEKLYDSDETNFEKTKDFGRIVNSHHHKRLKNIIQSTLDKGAELVWGFKTNDSENYLSPTILSNVPLDSPAFLEETFGPIISLIQYSTPEEALKIIRSTEKPLALYIFSRKRNIKNYFINNTSSGGIAINDTTVQFAHPNLPFGGVSYSGIGKAHGHYGFKAFSNEKAMVKQRIGFTSLKLIYPPYTKFTKTIATILTKYL